MKRTSLYVTFMVLLCVVAVPMAFGGPFSFSTGDIVVGVGNGQYKVFSPTGTLLTTLNTTSGSLEDTGGAFDSAGNLYVTNWTANSVSKFDVNGNLTVASFGGGYNLHPESIVFDKAGNLYIGQADGSADVLKFSPSGTLLATYNVATQNRGSDWIDLAADQKTLFYTSEGTLIKRFDLSTNTQLPDFANLATLTGVTSNAFALRILGDGSVLVAYRGQVVHLDSAGNLIRTYTAPGMNNAFALNILPNGTSFITANIDSTGEIFQFNIATGALEQTIFPNPSFDVAGLIVFGEITQGGPPPGAPEPASLVLCGAGLAAVGYRLRKRK